MLAPMTPSPRSTLALTLLALAVPASAQAADGLLDPTFGTAGHAVVAPSDAWSDGHEVVPLSGGRALVVGTASVDGGLSTTLATLGDDGKLQDLRTDAVDGGSTGDAAVRDAEGRIVVVGAAPGGGEEQRPRWLVARYHADGTPDTTFGDDGVALDAFGPYADATGIGAGATAVAVDAQGRIVVAGYAYFDDGPYSGANARHVVVARYTPDGHLDHSFGPDDQGWTEARPADGDASPHGIAVEPSGAILVAGEENRWSGGTSTDHQYDTQWKVALVARFDEHGALDAEFGDDGFATAELTSRDAETYGREAVANAIVRRADGRLVIAGRGTDAGGRAPAIAELNARGEMLDLTLLPTPAGGELGDVELDHDRVVVAGATAGEPVVYRGETPLATPGLLVARLGADGDLDDTFGDHGVARVDATEGASLDAIAVDGQDRLVATGTQDGQIHAVRLTSTAPAGDDPEPQPDDHGDDDHHQPPAGDPGPTAPAAGGGTGTKATPPTPVKGAATPPARRCVSRRSITFSLKAAGLKRGTLKVVDAKGRRLAAKRVRRAGGGLRLDLTGLAKGEYHVTITGTTAKGTPRRVTRTFRTCSPRTAK
jgi:uncharacterized delta-60 repeat protein